MRNKCMIFTISFFIIVDNIRNYILHAHIDKYGGVEYYIRVYNKQRPVITARGVVKDSCSYG